MSKAFAALLARRFAPLDFSTVPGFPHPVPSIDIWGDHLPRFAEKKGDNPSDHLIRFHQCMIQLDINHEDVLMKMFVFSLEGDAREWYRSLPPSSISSLKEFHTVFHHRCERFFAREILLEGCCEEFHSHIQNVYSSSCEHEILSFVVVQEEDLQDRVDVNIDDCVTEDSLDCSFYVPTTLNKNEKDYGVGEEEVEFSAESLFKEYCEKISHLETPAAYIEKSPPEINKFACTILQHKSADDKKQFIINNEVSLQLYSYLHTVEGGSHDNPENMQILSTFQLKQQQEVFSFNFIDPFVYYLKSSSSIDVKLLLPNKGWLCCIFELYISIPWFPTFIFRSKVLPAIQILRWLHWKHDFT
jgi:hypothetical protein